MYGEEGIEETMHLCNAKSWIWRSTQMGGEGTLTSLKKEKTK